MDEDRWNNYLDFNYRGSPRGSGLPEIGALKIE